VGVYVGDILLTEQSKYCEIIVVVGGEMNRSNFFGGFFLAICFLAFFVSQTLQKTFSVILIISSFRAENPDSGCIGVSEKC